MAIGKTAPNGTLNADGAFYSVQDVNVLLENAGGGGGGADLPTPTVADAGSVVVVDAEGKYALGAAGGGDLPTPTVADAGSVVVVGDDGKYELGEAGTCKCLSIIESDDGEDITLNKTYNEILTAILAGGIAYILSVGRNGYNVFTVIAIYAVGEEFFVEDSEERTYKANSADAPLVLDEGGDN